MKRRAALALTGLAATASITGCGWFSAESNNDHGDTHGSLRVAVTPAIGTAGIRIGVADGVFERAGVTVELMEQPNQEAALDQLREGTADLAFGSNVALLHAADSGMRLQLQGEAYQASKNSLTLVTLPESGYTTPTDKPAPRIAVDKEGGVGTLTTRSALEEVGVDMSKVTFVPMEFSMMPHALNSNKVDAAWMVEPYLTKIQKRLGATSLLDTAQGATKDFPMSSYAATAQFAKGHRQILAEFRGALTEAQRLATATRVQEELPKFADTDPATASLVSVGQFPDRINHERVQRVADMMLARDMIRNRLDVYEMTPNQNRS